MLDRVLKDFFSFFFSEHGRRFFLSLKSLTEVKVIFLDENIVETRIAEGGQSPVFKQRRRKFLANAKEIPSIC